jgi:hypothetical protein
MASRWADSALGLIACPPGDITRTRQPALQIIPLGAAWKAMQTGPGQRQIGGYLRGDADQR